MGKSHPKTTTAHLSELILPSGRVLNDIEVEYEWPSWYDDDEPEIDDMRWTAFEGLAPNGDDTARLSGSYGGGMDQPHNLDGPDEDALYEALIEHFGDNQLWKDVEG